MTPISSPKQAVVLLLFAFALCALIRPLDVAADPLPVAKLDEKTQVSFQKDVLPVFRKKCLACHNATDQEASLVLETPKSILAGGDSGPSFVPGKPDDSLLFIVARHADEPIMPPEDNDVDAANLTPVELAKLKSWIRQGAKDDTPAGDSAISWQTLPSGSHPIYALSMSLDGQYVAAARANEVTIYHVAARQKIGALTDPSLLKSGIYRRRGVAHLDVVQSIAFHPNQPMIATGGYRTVKIWRRPPSSPIDVTGDEVSPISTCSPAGSGATYVTGHADGTISLWKLDPIQLTARWRPGTEAITAVAANPTASRIAAATNKSLSVTDAKGKQLAQLPLPSPVASLCWLTDNSFAAGCQDGTIRIVVGSQPTDSQAGSGDKKPEWSISTELQAAKGSITSLLPMPDQPTQCMAAGADGQIRLWDVAAKRVLRTIDHGSPLAALALRSDGKRLVSVGLKDGGKLWDASNGKLLAHFKGDMEADRLASRAQYDLQLAELRVKGGAADVESGKKRVAAEEANAKRAAEEAKKAAEELAKQREALKKSTAEEKSATEKLASLQTALKQAEQALADQQAQEAKLKQQQSANKTTVQTATKKLQNSEQLLATAVAAQGKAEQAAKAKPEDEPLKAAVQAAIKAVQARTAERDQAKQTLAAAQQSLAKTTGQLAAIVKQKQMTTAKITQFKKEIPQQTAVVKKATDALKKAQTVVKQATAATESAKRTAERANRLIESAKEELKLAESTLTSLQAARDQFKQAAQQKQQQASRRSPALVSAAFSADGSMFAVGASDGRLYFRDGERGSAIESVVVGHQGRVWPLLLAGREVTINSGKGQLERRAILRTWELVRTIGSTAGGDEFLDRVTALGFSPDGKRLATGGGDPSRDGELKIWDVATGKLIRTLTGAHSDMVLDVAFSHDGTRLVSCAADRFVKVFDAATGKHLRSFEGHTGHVLGISWSADDRLLASAGADQSAKIWDARSGDQKRTIAGFKKEVTDIHFVGLGTNLLLTAGDPVVQLRRSDNGGVLRTFSGPTDYVYVGSVSADGKLLAAGDHNGIVRIWHDDGKLLVSFE